jgi:hypothetical protein
MEQNKVSMVEMILITEKFFGLAWMKIMNSINIFRLLTVLENNIQFGINNTLKDGVMTLSMPSPEEMLWSHLQIKRVANNTELSIIILILLDKNFAIYSSLVTVSQLPQIT